MVEGVQPFRKDERTTARLFTGRFVHYKTKAKCFVVYLPIIIPLWVERHKHCLQLTLMVRDKRISDIELTQNRIS